MDNIPAEARGQDPRLLTVRIKGGGWALVPEASTPTARILILTGNSASQSYSGPVEQRSGQGRMVYGQRFVPARNWPGRQNQ